MRVGIITLFIVFTSLPAQAHQYLKHKGLEKTGAYVRVIQPYLLDTYGDEYVLMATAWTMSREFCAQILDLDFDDVDSMGVEMSDRSRFRILADYNLSTATWTLTSIPAEGITDLHCVLKKINIVRAQATLDHGDSIEFRWPQFLYNKYEYVIESSFWPSERAFDGICRILGYRKTKAFELSEINSSGHEPIALSVYYGVIQQEQDLIADFFRIPREQEQPLLRSLTCFK